MAHQGELLSYSYYAAAASVFVFLSDTVQFKFLKLIFLGFRIVNSPFVIRMTKVDDTRDSSQVKWVYNRLNVHGAKSEAGRARIKFNITREKKKDKEKCTCRGVRSVSMNPSRFPRGRGGRSDCSPV